LVRRICEAYASRYLDLEQIASLVRAEGWISDKGRPVTTLTIRKLIKSEALIGNFVWGLGDNRHRIVKSSPTRRDGSVPRPIDDSNWRFVSQRAAHAAEHVLVVRMKGLYMPLDYLLLPEKVAEKHLPRTLQLRLPRALKPFHISATSELVSSLPQVARGLA